MMLLREYNEKNNWYKSRPPKRSFHSKSKMTKAFLVLTILSCIASNAVLASSVQPESTITKEELDTTTEDAQSTSEELIGNSAFFTTEKSLEDLDEPFTTTEGLTDASTDDKTFTTEESFVIIEEIEATPEEPEMLSAANRVIATFKSIWNCTMDFFEMR